jgi:hypothetical protein
MAIGLFPFYDRVTRSKARNIKTGTAQGRGAVMMIDGTDPADCKQLTGAGVTGLLGVVADAQGDPNNSGIFPNGSIVNVAEEGTVPVLFDAATVITRGATIISGATAGTAKVLAAEGKPYDVIGYAEEAKTIGGSPDTAAVRLSLHRVEA